MSLTTRRQREYVARHRLIVDTARALAEAEGWDAVTTRRLARRIEYSQPVLYSHFANKAAIVGAVALDGFAELTGALRTAAADAASPGDALAASAQAYLDFSASHPAVYDAMFVRTNDLPFATEDAPEPMVAAFAELRDALLAPLAGGRDLDTLAEVTWSAMHGLAHLTRTGRLRPDHARQRVALLVAQLTA